jgi:hypothetical protein
LADLSFVAWISEANRDGFVSHESAKARKLLLLQEKAPEVILIGGKAGMGLSGIVGLANPSLKKGGLGLLMVTRRETALRFPQKNKVDAFFQREV